MKILEQVCHIHTYDMHGYLSLGGHNIGQDTAKAYTITFKDKTLKLADS